MKKGDHKETQKKSEIMDMEENTSDKMNDKSVEEQQDEQFTSGELKKKAASGLFWMFGERILAQSVSFIVSVVLARILMPEEYGIIAIVLVFINIANVFVTSGLGQALIQKKDATELDFDTMFLIAHLMAWGIFVILFFVSPLIASFYNNPQLVWVLRVISLKLPIASFNSIQHAYVTRHMQFRKYFFSTLAGTLVSGAVGILLAIHGAGVWALVLQYLINSLMDTLILLFTAKWKPKFRFSFVNAKQMFGFSIKLTLSSLINTIYVEMQSMVIGKVYTDDALGYYKRGDQFPSLIITHINSSVGSVMFPTFSKVADNIDTLKSMTRRSMSVTFYIIAPLMFGLAAVAKPLVVVLLTEKWLPCVFFLQLACMRYMLQPIQTANCQAIKALGRSDIYLIMEIVKKAFGVTALLISLHYGINAIAIATVISVVFSAIVSMFPNIFLLKYSFGQQLKDLAPGFIMGVIMFGAVYVLSLVLFELPQVLVLIIQLVTGAIIYLGLSRLFKVDSFFYIVNYLKSLRGKV